jgi:hypothetical protein
MRSVDAQLRDLTSTALRRSQLGVTEGDFAVSGGGSVIVQDGGHVQLNGTQGRIEQYADDGRMTFKLGGELPGNLAGEPGCYMLLSKDGDPSADSLVFQLYSILPDTDHPNGYGAFQFGGDDFGVTANNGLSLNSPLMTLNVLDTGIFVWGNKGFHVQEGDLTVPSGAVHGQNVWVDSVPTSGSSANVHMGASGRLYIVSSSRRYKQDIQPAQIDTDAVLSLEGRTWRNRTDATDDQDAETRHVGFIAEELDEAGLTDYVTYNEDGLPESIQYDRLTVPLLHVVKEQQSQIDSLTRRLEQLEERLAG